MGSMHYHNLTEAARGESSFGPAVQGHGPKRFDFTLFFEQSILSLAPSALLLLILPIRVFQLLRQRRKVLHSPRPFFKTAAYIVFGALQLALLSQWAEIRGSSPAKRISLAASSFGFVDALALGTLSYLEHSRSVKPSSIISAYFFFSILFDAAQCRTLWLLGVAQTVAPLFTAMLVSKVIIFVLEMQEKRGILLQSWRYLGPESTSGVITRSVFWWLNALLARGFSASLSLPSLYDTDDKLQSERLLQQIQDQWSRRRKTGKYALFISVLHATKGALSLAVFPRICLMGFKFAQPFLVKRVITYVGASDSSEPESKNIGYGLIAAAGLIYAGTAITTGFYQHNLYRSLTMIRGLLVSLILTQTLELDAAATTGSSTLTLITSDVNSVSRAFESIHEIWANVIEVSIAIWLLERQLGVGCVGPAAVVVVCTLLMSRLSKFMGPAVKRWNGAIQKRVSITSSILGSIKETKMLGMITSWIDAIQSLRIEELDQSKKYRTLIVYLNLLGNSPSKIAPVMTFGVAILAAHHGVEGRLDTATAFASLTIMGLIVGPLAQLLTAVPGFVTSLGCFDRMQSFLDETGNTVYPGTEPTPQASGFVTDSQGGFELSAMQSSDTETGVIVARKASFGIKAGEAPILRDIDLHIPPRSLTVVAGKVGSGKTTLLRGLLGELPSEGHVKHSATGAAYCAQTTWLVNSTVRKNILGQSLLDEEWYDTVIRACALDRDFAQLPAGDVSKIGSKGITLSGGQKQRVALARAIYSRKSVMVIDDVLSGLDWATRSHVWHQVFGPTGLFRRQGATVLLATHALNHLEDKDNIILLDDGRISNTGTFGSLKADSLISSSSSEKSISSVDVVEDTPGAQTPDNVAKPKAEVDEDEMTALLRRSGEMSLYWYYFKSIGWRYGLTAVGIAIVRAVFDVLPDIWLRFWTDANKNQATVNTGRYFGIYAMFAILGLVLLGINIWWALVVTLPRSAARLHFTLLKTVMKAPLSFLTAIDTGDLINRFSKDMSLVDRDLPVDLFVTSGEFLATIAQACLVILGAQYLGALIPVALVFLYCLQKFYLRTSRQLRFLDLQATAPLYTHLLETIDGLSTIRAFGWQSATREASLRLLDESQKPHYLLFSVQRWLTLVLDLFVAGCAVILVTLGVVTPNATSAGAMALALASLLGFSQSLATLISSWTSLETSLGAISRLKGFETETPTETPPVHPEQLPAKWPSSGRLQIRDISASYSTATDTKPVLDGVSVDIVSGEKVAVCGRTGSGKSSLLLTLFRLLDLDSGVIMLDGVDTSQIDQDVLRGRLIAVPQEAMLFPGTLRFNLCPSAAVDDASLPSDEQIIAALDQVELWNAISLRGGLDTDVSDLALSHGQKQLVCLARAVLRRDSSAMLILDEAMSAVDDHTEEVMVKVIETEFAGHTVLSVVHRLNTVLKFDKIVMLEEGKVVEIGEPAVLLKGKGKFRDLWDGRS